jgi:hypothetical protein
MAKSVATHLESNTSLTHVLPTQADPRRQQLLEVPQPPLPRLHTSGKLLRPNAPDFPILSYADMAKYEHERCGTTAVEGWLHQAPGGSDADRA